MFIKFFCTFGLAFCVQYIIILFCIFLTRSISSFLSLPHRTSSPQGDCVRYLFLFTIFRHFCRRSTRRSTLWCIRPDSCLLMLHRGRHSLVSYCVYHEKPSVCYYSYHSLITIFWRPYGKRQC